ncbi:killer cell lectin-like receptor subfamily B member 1B allele A [Lacerta agilis]|uniref:killer cell lectin-like receptor subfamily B member 1B allele A n=1 Tax=Lacerta agilis TaxID=80427 RepID=UPI00141974F5|nr:killer cell lectin-like receptor subfamily B member 1B allele A [Lacerta agilis]
MEAGINSPCKVCSEQWQLHRDKCYWPSEDIKTWDESKHDCSTRDSQLLVIQDKEELYFIKNMTKHSKYWIGLLKSEKKWIWIRGSQLDQSLVFPSTDTSPCKVCPVQWQLHRDKCYWTSDYMKTWDESKHDCSTRDSQLLVIQDKEELDFIKNITKESNYWIGLSLLKLEKKWIWITGSQLDQSLFPEPNYDERNSCAAIKNKATSERCSTVFRWICQKDPLLL